MIESMRAFSQVALSSMLTVMAALPIIGFAQSDPGQTDSSDFRLFEEEVIAKGKGVEITRSDLDRRYTAFKANLAARGRDMPADKRQNIERRLLDRLIFTKLLINRATQEEKREGRKLAAKLVKQNKAKARSEKAFDQQIRSLGLTPEQFRRQLVDQAIAEKVVERKITEKLNVTDKEARQYYQEHPKLFEYPERARVSHILISTRDPGTNQPLPPAEKADKKRLAQKVLKQARSGQVDFADLVAKYSEEEATKEKGGTFTFPRGEMLPPFEAATFSMEAGEISNLVETKFGYHIIKLHKTIPSKQADFAKVAEDIKKRLRIQKTQERIPKLRKQLKQEANVKVLLSSEE